VCCLYIVDTTGSVLLTYCGHYWQRVAYIFWTLLAVCCLYNVDTTGSVLLIYCGHYWQCVAYILWTLLAVCCLYNVDTTGSVMLIYCWHYRQCVAYILWTLPAVCCLYIVDITGSMLLTYCGHYWQCVAYILWRAQRACQQGLGASGLAWSRTQVQSIYCGHYWQCVAYIFLNERCVILCKKCVCVTVHWTKNSKLLCSVRDLRLKRNVQDRRPQLRLMLTGNGWVLALYGSGRQQIPGEAGCCSDGRSTRVSVDTAVFRNRVL
jgi:hypothetical protein